ncbi:ATPase [Tumebacillus avium]|uniref:ATPase n=1 Tax=Tumebacillus avium TaxID=1903704 RepID=A0A1Y0IJU3_9BACL|nr:SRPBCC domain-containing protein [Tumebacillus avium]ARU60782.1 ATPase [Tumebacillus avium]
MTEQGKKLVGQTATAGFQIGVRRTLPMAREQAWQLLTSQEFVKMWLGTLPTLTLQAGHAFHTKEGISGEMRVVKPMEQLRLTWQRPAWNHPSTLQIRLLSNHPDKTTVSFHQEKLADQFMREEMKVYWEAVLAKMLEQQDLE